MNKKVYIICPVRSVSEEDKKFLNEYVANLESQGYEVHYPPRDVDQTDDGIGMKICMEHRKAMWRADEVHVLWDESSGGSKFDLGMAFALLPMKRTRFVLIRPHSETPHKSYGNVLWCLVHGEGHVY